MSMNITIPPVCAGCGYPLCSECALCQWHCSTELQCGCPDNWHGYEDDEDNHCICIPDEPNPLCESCF